MKKKLIRHGDITFIPIKKLPTDLTEEKTNVILKSGSGGNPHTFKNGKIYFKKVDDFIFGYFKANDTKIYHPEHGSKKIGNLVEADLPDGIYELRRQCKIGNEQIKPVID